MRKGKEWNSTWTERKKTHIYSLLERNSTGESTLFSLLWNIIRLVVNEVDKQRKCLNSANRKASVENNGIVYLFTCLDLTVELILWWWCLRSVLAIKVPTGWRLKYQLGVISIPCNSKIHWYSISTYQLYVHLSKSTINLCSSTAT